jgi:hypothetical protein
MWKHSWSLVKRISDQVRGVVVNLVVSKHCDINKRNTFSASKYDVSNVFNLFMIYSNI